MIRNVMYVILYCVCDIVFELLNAILDDLSIEWLD